jgi:hypothetical protein
MPDPEEIPENTMAFPAGNSSADTGCIYLYRNTRRPKLAGETVHQKILP